MAATFVTRQQMGGTRQLINGSNLDENSTDMLLAGGIKNGMSLGLKV